MRYRESTNSITPAIPFFFAYDLGGNQTFSGAFLTWDTVKIKTSHFQYTADDDRITLKTNSSGLYKIHFNCSMDVSAGNTRFSIYKNGSEEDGSYSESFSGTVGQTGLYENVNLDYIVYLEKNDYVQVYGDNINGTDAQSTPSSCRIIIEYLPMQGWDNSTGGRTEYSGGVMR